MDKTALFLLSLGKNKNLGALAKNTTTTAVSSIRTDAACTRPNYVMMSEYIHTHVKQMVSIEILNKIVLYFIFRYLNAYNINIIILFPSDL